MNTVGQFTEMNGTVFFILFKNYVINQQSFAVNVESPYTNTKYRNRIDFKLIESPTSVTHCAYIVVVNTVKYLTALDDIPQCKGGGLTGGYYARWNTDPLSWSPATI